MATNGNEILNSSDANEDQSFNWKLFLTIGWLTRWWIVLYIILAFVASYLIGRYTSPLYESQADVQFKDKSKDNSIDLGILVSNTNVDRLNEEMTILNSKGYKIKALKSLPLQVSYFIRERVKEGEVYNASPFDVKVQVLDSSIVGKKIDLHVIDPSHYVIKYEIGGEHIEYNFDFEKPFSTPEFNITAHLKKEREKSFYENYYFVINDINREAERIEGKVEIDVDNLYGGKIVINYRDNNPVKTKDVVNTIAGEIVNMSLTRKAGSAEMIINFIEDQIDSLEKELYDQENLLKTFKKENLIISPELAESNIVQKLNEIDQAKFQVTLEQKSLKWLKDFTNNKNSDLDALANYFGDLEYSDFTPYLNSLVDLNKEKETLILSVPSSDPRLTSINKQISKVTENFKQAIVNAEKKLEVRDNYLTEEKNKYEGEFLKLPEQQSEFARLTRLNDLKEKYYLLLLEKQSEYEITLAGMSSDYIILDSGERGSLVAPVKAKIWGLAILICIGISFAHIYLRFLLHSTIIGVPDVEKSTNVPLLGALPMYNKSKMDTPQIVVTASPKSHIAESFRAIRSNMQYFLKSDDKGKLIVITSTVSGEGKTFTALNLANVISSAGKKVILVDFDLRKPKVHKAFKLKNQQGVSTILINKDNFQDCIQPLEEAGCDILIAGPVPPNPAELLVSPACDKLMADLLAIYDFVIIDSPPVGIVSDSIPIMAKADLAIYMIRVNYSKRNFIGNVNR
ncbi:MAG: polysaccharide biosynthesis tyrosine autokinase, partial [Chitinophagales bacterium]